MMVGCFIKPAYASKVKPFVDLYVFKSRVEPILSYSILKVSMSPLPMDSNKGDFSVIGALSSFNFAPSSTKSFTQSAD